MEKKISERLAFYREHGYLIIKNCFTSKEVESMRASYRECIANRPEGIEVIYEDDGSTPRSIMSYHQNIETLSYFTHEARVLDIVNEIVGPKYYVSQSKINPKAPLDKSEIKGKKWDYHRGFSFWNLLDGIPEPSMVSSFIFLTEQTEENGAVFVLEGSHSDVSIEDIKNEIGADTSQVNNRKNDTSEYLSIQIRPEKISEYKKKYKRVVLEGNPGDLVFMHPNLLHASEPNMSDVSRDLMISVYNSTDNLPQTPRNEHYLCERDFEPIAAVRLSHKLNEEPLEDTDTSI